jgi:hypothetical protein
VDGNNDSFSVIDIGAYEFNATGSALLGDYNRNGNVDAADYVMWRKTLGTIGLPAYSGADGDGDTIVDQDDYGVWRGNFGQPFSGAGSGAASTALAVTDEFGAAAVAPREITPVQRGKDANSLRSTDSAVVETRILRRDSNSQRSVRVHRNSIPELSGDELCLLLAIDRVRRSSQDDWPVTNHSDHDQDRDDMVGSHQLIDESMFAIQAARRPSAL